jgi:hypothetical protein
MVGFEKSSARQLGSPGENGCSGRLRTGRRPSEHNIRLVVENLITICAGDPKKQGAAQRGFRPQCRIRDSRFQTASAQRSEKAF